MRKRKLSNKIFGENPWDVEVELSPADLNPITARARVINRYMHNGDLRPLAAAIKEGRRLHPEVLDFLATMISEGRLIAKPRGRRKRLMPSRNTRDYMAALLVERGDTFEKVANILGMGEAAVRKAVTLWRKRAK